MQFFVKCYIIEIRKKRFFLKSDREFTLMKTFHLISNPVAGKNKAAKNLKKVEELLTLRGIDYQTHLSQGVKDATEIAKRLTGERETDLIVVGGDGTLHEVLNGIGDLSACRLGLIPSGTGNDFAVKLAIPFDVEKALAVILDGEAKATDCLEIGGVRCMNVGGLGMDVDVLERCQRGRLKGKIKYLWSLVRSLFAFKGYELEFVSGERRERHTALIAAACNGSQFGGGIRVCPEANIEDGKMNAMIVEDPRGKWKIIKAFLKLMKGKVLELPITTHFLCEELTVYPAKPCTVQLDGELYKDLEFKAKICKGLRFYRP